jgi:hypothetical protein
VIHKVRKTLDDGAAISTPHDNSAKSRLLACSRASPDIPAVVTNGVAFGSHYTMEAKVQIDSLKLPDGHLRTMFGMHHAAAGTKVIFCDGRARREVSEEIAFGRGVMRRPL